MHLPSLLTSLLVPILTLAVTQEPLSAVPTAATTATSQPLSNGKYELRSEGIRALFVPYGASLANLFIPDKNGRELDVVLGFDNASFYSTTNWHPHLNGVPGRYANRIRNGTFTIDGTTYHTDLNDKGGFDTLHGGSNGWDYRNWTVVKHTTDSITFCLEDPAGEMGFPGAVSSHVTYSLTPHRWHIRMTARATTERTPVMLTSHTYLNLDGFRNPGTDLALNHTLYMPFARGRVQTDAILVPTGELLDNAKDGAYDFWSGPKQVGAGFGKAGLEGGCGYNCTGFDTCFINDLPPSPDSWRNNAVAYLASPDSGIQLKISTNQPLVQLYSCNNMNGTFPLKSTQGFLDGSQARAVQQYGCVVLEVEDYIDGINHLEWGREKSQVFGPEDGEYVLEAVYEFSSG